jgi:1-acyl-sn-glycerol-3-phosphate acyltransferase
MSAAKNEKKKVSPKRAAKKTIIRDKPTEEPTHSREAVSRAIADAAAAAPTMRTRQKPIPKVNYAPAAQMTTQESEREAERAGPPAIEPDVTIEPSASDDENENEAATSSHATGADVADRIRELEQRLDRMIEKGARAHEREPRSVPPPPSSRALPVDGEPTAFDTARELLSTDFYLRKWGKMGMRNRSEEVDDFGFDPVYEKKVQPIFDFLYEKYFRVDLEGIENVPNEGRCLLVANHSGTLPYDGVMIKVAVKREHAAKRDVRWLAEDFIFHFPFLGSMSNRIGAVRACQENAERLLRKEALVAVFPEGVKGIGKLFKERYKLQRFGRGGFIKLCLRTGSPIVPVAVIGAEEANPMIGRIEYLSKAIGVPYIPVTPTFPLLGPLGLIPAPTKWKIVFGEKIDFDGYGAEAAEDEILVGRLAERVRATIQGMLDRGVGERRSIFFG